MVALFDLSVLAAVVAIFLLLGIGAANAGADSRPGFGDDQSHHNSARGDF
jgi:hypothetical protein